MEGIMIAITIILILSLIAGAACTDAVTNIKQHLRAKKWYQEAYEAQLADSRKRGEDILKLREQLEYMQQQLRRHNTLDAWVASSEYEDEIEKLRKKVKAQALVIKGLDMEVKKLRSAMYPDEQ